MIDLIHDRATGQQITEMLEALETYIKLAVDIRRGILAGGCIIRTILRWRSRIPRSVPDVSLEVQAMLVDLQILLALWHRKWYKIHSDVPQVAAMSRESRAWAERLLDLSGLLAGA